MKPTKQQPLLIKILYFLILRTGMVIISTSFYSLLVSRPMSKVYLLI